MSIQGIFYWLSTVGIIITGGLVILRQRRPVFVYYSLFSFLLAAWLICQFFIGPNTLAGLWLGIGFICVELLVSTFLLFAYAYPNGRTMPKKYWPLLALPVALFGPFSFSSLMATATIDTNGELMLVTGPLYYPQNAVLILYLFFGLGMLFVKLRTMNLEEKKQLHLILWGFGQFLVANILAGLIFVSNNQAQALRPFSAFIMVAIISYTIAYRKLFDIRLVVVRSLVYVLTLTSVGFIYGFVAFGLVGRVLFNGESFSLQQQIVYTVLAVVLAFTFQPIERFFNRVTNSIFYRDAYDSQDLLNKLGTVFSLEIEINKVINKSVQIIADELKLSYAIILVNNEGEGFRSAGHGKAPDLSKLKQSFFEGLTRKVTVIDNEESLKNKDIFQVHNIALVVRLVTQDGVVGYLILGPKQSGNVFTGQDTDVMTIISNSLAVAIQNTLLVERIQEFNVTLQQRVDDATRKLRRTNEKLKALDETKDDFISMASHQLRTPLTSIKGYISMVMEGDAGKISKTQQEMLTQAFFSSQRMVYLISDLLNVSRLKTGKFIIEPTRVNLATMVEQEINQLKEAAAARNLTLSFDRPDDFPDVMLDETKTRQVIMNFSDNAIYYTPAGGHVRVRVIDTPTTIEFRVEDNGIGVAKSDQPHLFTKFYRAGNARKARPDGTGLGLFMAKKVIVAEEGSLIFTSEEGKGSTFGFVFSKSKVLAPPLAKSTPEKLAKTKAAVK